MTFYAVKQENEEWLIDHEKQRKRGNYNTTLVEQKAEQNQTINFNSISRPKHKRPSDNVMQ